MSLPACWKQLGWGQALHLDHQCEWQEPKHLLIIHCLKLEEGWIGNRAAQT